MRVDRCKTALQYLAMWTVTSAFLLVITHTNKANKESQEKDEASQQPITWSDGCEPNEHSRQRLPVGLVIGAENTGSAVILEQLQIEPRFKVASDTHFFSDLKKYKRGSRFYRTLMPSACKLDITLDCTSSYLEDEEVISRVRQFNRSIRLLVVLRDPIDRALDDFKQIKGGGGAADFEKLVVGANGTINTALDFISRSSYEVALSLWLKAFPLSQWQFIDANAFMTDPVSELNAVASFFGLQPRFGNLGDPGVSLSAAECLETDCDLSGGNELTDSTKKALRNLYKPHVRRLSDLIQMELPWMAKYLH